MAYDNQNNGNYQKTQESIVRQSTLKWLIDYCELNNHKLSLMETIRITNWITSYCINGCTEDLERNIKLIDTYLQGKNKKPKNAKMNGMEKDFETFKDKLEIEEKLN